jgi:hypothetical protein
MLAACLSLALTACDTESVEPAAGPGSTEDVRAALAALPSAQVIGAHEDGVPYMIRGRFGTSGTSLRGLSAAEAHAQVSTALARLAPVFRLQAADLVVRRVSQDEQGHTHIRYAQTKNGLPVIGHELVVHVDEHGNVYAANGSARDGEPVPFQARIAPEAARAAALESTPGTVHTGEAPRLVYAHPGSRLRQRPGWLHRGAHLGHPRGAQPFGVLGQQHHLGAGNPQDQRGRHHHGRSRRGSGLRPPRHLL